MQLRITCTQCSKELLVPVSAAGKTAKCPGCQSFVKIPLYFEATPVAAHNPAPTPALDPVYAQAPSSLPTYSYPSSGASQGKKSTTKRPSRSGGTGGGMRILMIAMACIGILFVGGMLLIVGLAMVGKQRNATLSPASIAVPQLPDLGVASRIPGTNSTFQFIRIKQGSGPGQSMQFRVYLPPAISQ